MSLFRRWLKAGLFTIVGLSSLPSHAQIWAQMILDRNLTLQLVSAENLPCQGTFWSLQRTNCPPLPSYTPYLRDVSAPVYLLDAQQSIFLVDDSEVDYAAIYAEHEAERALRKLEWENGLLSDEGYWALEGGNSSAMMISSLASSYAYGNAVYLADMTASFAGAQTTANFSIAGGTNNVPYDILTSTNAASPLADWQWLGIGYTSNRYTFANQPGEQAFYILAKPQKTMVVGWGNSDYGQADVPPGITNAVMVAGGDGHSLALLNDGSVTTWGRNDFGQRNVPTNLAGVAMVAAAHYHSVALLTNGTVTAWGWNGTGIYGPLTGVPPDLTNAVVISAQELHSLALRNNGTVVAWGDNNAGQTNVPVGLTNVTAIAAGGQHSLAAKSDGTVVAWGYNNYGQCTVPVGLSNVVDVAAGWRHSVALRRDGTVVAWGANTYGQTNVPGNLSNVVAIAAGGDGAPLGSGYTLALKKDGTLVAWGQSAVNTPMIGLSNVIAIAGGLRHALAIRSGPRTPVLTLLPTNQFQLAGSDVTFASRGVGLYGVTYQWKTNGVNLAGATNATLTLTNVQATQAVDYSVTASNEVGTITSPAAMLTLVTAPIILTQTPLPTNQVAIFQENLTLSVTASAPGQNNGFPLSYQWKFNGTNISGATSNRYALLGGASTVGAYTVVATNAAGSASANWQVTNFTYLGSYVAPGTLAYHLATNAVARTNGYTPTNMVELSGWSPVFFAETNFPSLTNSTWSTNFWLKGVQGLSATSIGYSNGTSGQGAVTMLSPRHFVFASHAGPGQTICLLDTNNVIHWRRMLAQTVVGGDISIGIFDNDLPSSVGFLPVVPTNLFDYLPTNFTSIVQGIGMNSSLQVFSQPMVFANTAIFWDKSYEIPFGVATNWSVGVFLGDSSCPERLLVGNQLVSAAHNFGSGGGPNYAFQFETINQKMHFLSTNNNIGTDYQLTPFSMTNWPSIH